jgi:hypothetical protein
MLIPLSLRRISSLAPSYSTARRVLQNLPPGLVCRRSGSALSPSDHPRPVLILIDAVSTLIVAPYRPADAIFELLAQGIRGRMNGPCADPKIADTRAI